MTKENEKSKNDVWKHKIEDIIESKNGWIQVCFFIAVLILSGVLALGIQSSTAVAIELLTLISFELLNLNIKDSIIHRKLNRMGVRIDMYTGGLFKVGDFNILPFFEKTQSHLFISGITLNFFFQKFQSEIVNLLENGKKLYVIIVSPELISESAKLYYGVHSDKVAKFNEGEVYDKQLMTLNAIKNPQTLYKYFENGQLRLRIAKNVFSTSFVAYDIFDNSVIDKVKRKSYKEIKASFYQYECTITRDEPNIIVDSKNNENWYDFFAKTMTEQWKDSEIIDTEEKLTNLINKLVENNPNSSTGREM